MFALNIEGSGGGGGLVLTVHIKSTTDVRYSNSSDASSLFHFFIVLSSKLDSLERNVLVPRK